MPAASRTPDELATLCKQAEALASRRKERPSTVHLLLALCGHDTVAVGLLDDHRVSPAKLEIVASTAPIDEDGEALRRAVQTARDLAARTKAHSPGSAHVLLALLGERRCAAYALLERCGVDVARLRATTMQIAVGATAPRRMGQPKAGHPQKAPAPEPPPPAPAPPPSRAKPSQAIAVSVAPTPRNARVVPGGNSVEPSTTPAPPAPVSGGAASGTQGSLPSAAVARGPAQASSPASSPLPSGAQGQGSAAVAVRPTAIAVPVVPQLPSGKLASPPKPLPRPAPPAGPTPDERFGLDAQKQPALSAIGKNLTLAAAKGDRPRVVGRDEEIDRCLDILAKRSACCPVLLGAPGVGKSATLLGLAAAAAQSDPGSSDDRVLVELRALELTAGAQLRGAVGERVAAVAREAQASSGRVVLVLDDIHQALSGEAGDELASELRGAIARGEIVCVGASTPEDYRRVIEADPALARRFTPVLLEEPSREEAFLVLREAAPGLVSHHGVQFPDEALASAVGWSVRYMPGRALPDKALSVLDLAGARARRRGAGEVGPPLVAQVISEMTDVPAERMLETDGERMLALEQTFAETVVGHRAPLARVARMLRRNAAGIRGRRPIGTFLLLGPTGVGKTETAKAIAQALFHSPDAMTRLDLSEYAEPHSIARMLGAPPGYVGHEAGGQLTEAVRRRPYQVVLLDEIEKAHRDVLEAFLGVFDEGRLTDGRGRTVDFTNTVLVLTSNLGAHVAVSQPSRAVGFRAGASAPAEARLDEDAVVAAARESLPPELYNRIDEVLVFAPLSREDVREIARRLLASLASSLQASRGLRLEVDDAVAEALLVSGGFDPELGARPMRRAIGKHVEGPLAELILRDRPEEGARVRVSVDERGAIVVRGGAIS